MMANYDEEGEEAEEEEEEAVEAVEDECWSGGIGGKESYCFPLTAETNSSDLRRSSDLARTLSQGTFRRAKFETREYNIPRFGRTEMLGNTLAWSGIESRRSIRG